MNAPDPQPAVYLDATDLADILGLSLRTIILRARHRPWLLPPRAELLDREPVRWRPNVLMQWRRLNPVRRRF
ncbi:MULTISPECIES: hypothetical protein [Paraburkholderia]|uniref:hypothetical protein n=1 Tax=Paraburkholderia TaxID=1822464 RepID=UPI0013E9F99B|nr:MULTISPECIES: hypothetical protein [Paraburkholderia]MDR8397132.1 hypothetical protein [Paraburkholderia sp. USG1]